MTARARIGSLLVARMGSTRLPGKVLRVVHGKPLVEHLIDRVRLARHPETLVLCTSTRPEDDALEDVARRTGIGCFRGHPTDVLDRCLGAARAHGIDFFPIIEGDEVFCDAEFIDRVVEHFWKTDADYVEVTGLPLGAFVEGIKTRALARVCEAKEGADSDGWPRYFTETGLCRVETVGVPDFGELAPECRMTLDYPEDFALIRAIYDRLYAPDRIPSIRDVMAFLGANPELRRTNQHLIAVYADACRRFAPVRLKGAAATGR